MSRLINFVRTTALGGLLVIVPIGIVLFVLGKLLYALYSVAQTLMYRTDVGIDDAVLLSSLALLALVGLCFATGLVVRTRLGDALRRWFARNVAKRIPMYNAIASLTQRFAGIEGNEFAPVEVDLYGSDTRAIGFLVETLPDGRCAVFVPTAPVATVGNLYLVPGDRVARMQASMADTVSVVTQWGVDAENLFGGKGPDGQPAGNQSNEPPVRVIPIDDQVWSSMLAPDAQLATLFIPLLHPDSDA